jgi:hypothetical protein
LTNLFDRRRLGDHRRKFGAGATVLETFHMNIGVQASAIESASPCLVDQSLYTDHAKDKFRIGEIVMTHSRMAVVLPCEAKGFIRFMECREIDGEYRSIIFFNLKRENFRIERLECVVPTLKLEESGCHLRELLATTDAGSIIRNFVDMPAFEATLTRWYETLRSIPAGSLDALRNVMDGTPASNRLLDAYEKPPTTPT